MKKLKVLSLGWEFPPIINGGLGVACYGLSQSLAKLVDLTLIIPKSDIGADLPGANLIGLNMLNPDHYRLTKEQLAHSYESFANVIEIPQTNFSPYSDNELVSVDKKESTHTEVVTEKKVTVFTHFEDLPTFNIEELYGEDIYDKIQRYAQVVAHIAATLEFDVIHAHDWMTFLAGMEVKAQSGKPLVLHVHALETDRTGTENRGFVFNLEKQAMQYADSIIAVSKFTADSILKYYQVSLSKVHAVHNGVEAVVPYKSEKGFPEKMVLFLGRLTGQKGPGYFMEVAQRVLNKYPDVRFVMAGSGDRLKTLIETGAYKKLGTKFHFTGFMDREKVYQLLSMADVYCMPSVSEPFGLSALEAAQFGVPTVISRQSGVSEVLKGALSTDFWDVDRMAKNIVDLLTNDKIRERVINENYKNLETLTWDNSAEQVERILRHSVK